MTNPAESLIVSHMRKLRNAADKACRMAILNGRFSDVIDPEHRIFCNHAEYWIDSIGDSGYRVYISGAPTDAHALRSFIDKILEERGFGTVKIRMEK